MSSGSWSALVSTFALFWIVGIALVGCREEPHARGGLMLMVSRDGPLELDHLEIEVSSGGRILLSNSYREPEEVTLPTTVAIVSNSEATASVEISVVGWAGGVPLDRRDAIVTQVPTDRVVGLAVVLSARCSDKLTLGEEGTVGSSCGEGNTCDNDGNCSSVVVRAAELPSYSIGDEENLGSGGFGTGGSSEPLGGRGGAGILGEGGSAADACAGVICDTPPPATCGSKSQLLGYLPSGRCQDGECRYDSRTVDCECEDDACTTDPCASVSCEDSVCVLGTCLACTPSQTMCEGRVPHTCTPNGAWKEEPVTAGACDAECTPSTTRCAGQAKQQICDELGRWEDPVACNSQTCIGEGVGSHCAGVCAPGQTRCADDDLQECTVAGDWGKAKSCSAPRSCQGGACACPALTPEECNDNCTNYQTDKFNCGECGHSCQGGACIEGVCQPFTLYSNDSPMSIALSSSRVYWSSASGDVYSVPLNGATTPVSTRTAFDKNCVMGLALDSSNAYGLAYDCKTIGLRSVTLMKVPLAGGGAATKLGTSFGGSFPPQPWRCLAVDATNIYLSNYDTDDLFQVPIEGGGATTKLWDGGAWPKGVAVNGANVFWGTNRGIMTMPVGGSSAETIAASDSGDYVVADASYVYFTTAGTVMKALIKGSTPVALAEDAAGPLVIDSSNVYFLGASTVRVVSKLGGSVRVLASGQSDMRDIAVNSDSVFWVTSSAVMKAAL